MVGITKVILVIRVVCIVSLQHEISMSYSGMPHATNVISSVKPLGFPFETADPFIFCVYHNDQYPAGDDRMQAPRKGNGADFNPSAPYRMYHGSSVHLLSEVPFLIYRVLCLLLGDRIPGFPQHPHRGFEVSSYLSI